jgi:ATP phosphoribosyltransferase
MLKQLVEEVPDLDLLPLHGPFVEVAQQAFGLIQDDHIVVQIERLAVLLKGALMARNMVGLKLNLPEAALEVVSGLLPSLRKPTVSRLAQEGWVALETVLTELQVRELIPQLKELGAEGIIEYPLNKVIE